MTPIQARFVMDEAYLREFHREWVSALGKGFRTSKRMGAGLVAASLMLTIAGRWLNSQDLKGLALVSLGFGLLVTLAMAGRRAAWLRNCRSLPWYGKPMLIEVRDGDLVQVKDHAGDPRFERTGALVLTPSGYLVKYRGVLAHTHSAVSTTDASVYIPHRAIVTAMTRNSFLASLRSLKAMDG